MRLIVSVMVLILGMSCKYPSEQAAATDALIPEAEPKSVLQGEGTSIAVYDFEGLQHLLSRKDEKTYVLNFWATWCKPCIEELPHFEAVRDKYSEQNLEVVLVSLDFPSRAEQLLIPFVEKKELKSTVVLLDDPKQNTWIPKVDESWSGAIPATVIFNSENRAFYEKSFNFNDLEAEVLRFLN